MSAIVRSRPSRLLRVSAVLFDVFGTLVHLEAPGPALREELLARTGTDVGEERAAQAFVAEISCYLEHHLEGSDEARLDDLRTRCARQIQDSLAEYELELGAVREAMLAALRFRAFPDVEPALAGLRDRGLTLVAASNWDVSLPQGLERAGLAGYFEGAVSSAVAGAAKPDPAVFRQALAIAGCRPAEAFHVGDSPSGDVEGARAAGIPVALLDRAGTMPDPPEGVAKIASLAELASLL